MYSGKTFLLFLLSICPLLAQGPTVGSINGAITDSSGAAVAQVEVTAEGAALPTPQTTLSDSQGLYRFATLPSGTYKVTFKAPGFAVMFRDGLKLDIGFTATVNITMGVATQQQTVNVSGESPVVDISNTNLQNTFGSEQFQNIPSSRDVWALASETPGLTMARFDVGGSTAGTQTDYTAYGFIYQQRVQLNGINITEQNTGSTSYLDYGSFQEVSFGTAANDASMPSPGVLVNMVLKSGGNQFHGDAYFDYENPVLQGDNINTALLRKGVGQGTRISSYYDPNVSIGGPILKDKLWFFGSYRNQYIGVTTTGFPVESPGTGPPFSTRLTNYTYNLTYQLNAKNRISQFLSFMRKQQPFRDADSSHYADAVYNEDLDQVTTNLDWQSTISPRAVLEVNGGGWGYNWTNSSYKGPSGQFEPRRTDLSSGDIAGAFSPQRYSTRRYQGTATFSLFTNFLKVNHDLKIGWLSERENYAQEFYSYQNDAQLTFNSAAGAPDFTTPYQVTIFNTPNLSNDILMHHGAFVQDKVTVTRNFTLNLGLRWDFYNNSRPTELIRTDDPYAAFFYAGAALPNGYSIPASFPNYKIPGNSSVLRYPHAIAPRLGFAWDVFGTGKTVIKGNWGRYYLNPSIVESQLANPLLAPASGGGTQQSGFTFGWNDLNHDGKFTPNEFGPFVSNSGSTSASIDPHIRDPYLDDMSGFVEHELAPDLTLRVGFIYKRLRHNWQQVETAQVASLYTQAVTAFDPGVTGVSSTGGTPFTVYDIPSSTTIPNSVQQVQTPDANSAGYRNLDVTVNKRLSNRWSLTGNYLYTWSHYTQNGLATNPDLAINNIVRVGSWSGKIFGTYHAPLGLVISPILRAQEGIPVARIVNVTDLNIGTFSAPVTPVGAYRQDNVFLFDTRIDKEIPLGERMRLGIFVDAFNLFNTAAAQNQDNVTGVRTAVVDSQSYSYQRFLRPTTLLSPRIFRFGVKFSF